MKQLLLLLFVTLAYICQSQELPKRIFQIHAGLPITSKMDVVQTYASSNNALTLEPVSTVGFEGQFQMKFLLGRSFYLVGGAGFGGFPHQYDYISNAELTASGFESTSGFSNFPSFHFIGNLGGEYHFFKPGRKLVPYVGLNLQFCHFIRQTSSTNSSYIDNDGVIHQLLDVVYPMMADNGLSVRAEAGLQWFLGKRMLLGLSANVLHSQIDVQKGSRYTVFDDAIPTSFGTFQHLYRYVGGALLIGYRIAG